MHVAPGRFNASLSRSVLMLSALTLQYEVGQWQPLTYGAAASDRDRSGGLRILRYTAYTIDDIRKGHSNEHTKGFYRADVDNLGCCS